MTARAASPSNRRRRARPLIAVAGVAFVAGAIAGATHSSPSPAPGLAAGFVQAWAHHDYAAMYSHISPASQRRVSPSAFAQYYRQALMLATAYRQRVIAHPSGAPGGVEVVPVIVRTRLFGTLTLRFSLPIVPGPHESEVRIRWSRSLAFPGLRPGELLGRRTQLPARAALLARNGTLLADGPATAAGTRSSPLGAAASAIVGEVGPIPSSRLHALMAEGVPATAIVGVSGLELAADRRLRGTPGGELLAVPGGAGEASGATAAGTATSTAGGHTEASASALTPATGGRVLARAAPRAGGAVRTTISPAVQTAVTTALGGHYGGVIAIEPASGQVLGVAGIALDGLQPPGSTFKMITVSGVLEAGVARPTSSFPYATAARLDGVLLHNAHNEECGGSLVQAFAVSCNSVFSPLGVKLGASRLVAMAERYGFNQPPSIEGAAESTLPPASQIQGELAVGSTAIGQGQVLATPLQMATVAATIANGGRRPTPTLVAGTRGAGRPRVLSAATARTVRGMMLDVVRYGTGTSAGIPGVEVAGKTGTAELGDTGSCDPRPESQLAEGDQPGASEAESSSAAHASARCASEQNNPKNTDAWFAAFAPARHPRIAVGVLMVRDGAGGESAAPVARQVIEAALG